MGVKRICQMRFRTGLRRFFGAHLIALLVASGCGQTTDGGSAGTSGSTGSGGSAGAGAAGSGGAAARAGAAGSSGTSGASGSGGGGEPECTKDLDCVLVNNCCDCKATPASAPPTPCAGMQCLVPTCEARQTGAKAALCNLGRCVLDVSCDASKVTCARMTPQCPAGEVPAVNGSCWTGACVRAEQCAGVTSCAACGSELACVVADSLSDTFHCATPAKGCASDRSCACLGPSVCITPFGKCADSTPDGAIHCSCSTC